MLRSFVFPLVAALVAVGAVQAAPYPGQPVQLIVSFPPGGATDLVARALAQAMSQDLGQPLVVHNRGGAGGALGTAAIAQANPGGDTVGLISVAALTILPHLQPTPYSLADFSYICQAYDIPVVVSVAPQSRFRTLDELIQHARAHPGTLNYATVGPGSLPNMAALDLMRTAGIQMNHIPYKGEALAVTDLLGGHVDVYFGTNAIASRSGLHRLAVAAAERTDDTGDTPTLKEAGYDVVWSIIGGVLGPRQLAAAHRDRLEHACQRAATSPAYHQALHTLNIRPRYASGPEFQATLQHESDTNRQLLGSVGLLAP